MITTDYLDSLAQTDFAQVDTGKTANDLIAAVDEGRITRSADIGYALAIAAQLLSDGDDPRALEIAERALAEEQGDDVDSGPTHALRGTLLTKAGRADEGMAEFAALRSRLLEDPLVAEYLADALIAADLTEVAELWLNEAADTLIARLPREEQEPTPEFVETLFMVVRARAAVREELDREVDGIDELAMRMEADLADATDFELGQPAVVFWPEAEWRQLRTQLPDLDDWDAHRMAVERSLQRVKESGPAELALVAASVEELRGFAEDEGEPVSRDVLVRYEEAFTVDDADRGWPPGRNDPCWCGSGQKYKRCCLVRGRL